MSLKKLISGFALASLLALGVGAGLSTTKGNVAHEAKADTTILLKGDFNSWGDSDPLTDADGDGIWSVTRLVSANNAFKIVVNGTWCAYSIVDTGDNATKQYVGYNENNDDNLWFKSAGTYLISVDTNNSNKLSVSLTSVQNVSLAGSMNEWTAREDGYTFTNNGDGTWSLNDVDIDSGESFKIVVNNGADNWCGGYCLNDQDEWSQLHFPKQTSGSDANISVSLSGVYSFVFEPNAKLNYGTLTISGVLDTISVTLKATFTSALDSWIDLYLPGSFNSWSESALMTPNAGRTEFTYSVAEVVPGAYKYQLVACYHSTGFQWTTYIDSTDQDLSIAEGDAGTVKIIRENLTAPSMPQEYISSSSKIQITMSSRVDANVNIYFASLLTGWADTAVELASAIMTPNAGRTVFTWNIPNSTTPVGTYQYKIVAMYANGGQTAVAYDYLVYSDNGNNASVTFGTAAKTEELESDYDLSVLGAIAFSREFTTDLASACTDENANNASAVSAKWSTHTTAFGDLTDGAKTQFGSNNEEHIVQARKLYLHCVYVREYVSAWTGAPEASRIVNPISIDITNNASNTTLIVVITVSAIALIGVGAYFYLRKRKED